MKRLTFPLLLILILLYLFDLIHLEQASAPPPRACGAKRQPRTRRMIESATPPIRIFQPREFHEADLPPDVVIVLPGAPGGYGAAQKTRRQADENAALKWKSGDGKSRYTQAADEQDHVETRAEQLKRESNERILEALRKRKAECTHAS